MTKTFLPLLILLIFFSSCATEKSNTSPIPAGVSTEKKSDDNAEPSLKIAENTNAAEISSLLSSFPVFSKKDINDEISILKYSLQNYLYALDAGNLAAKNKQLKNMQNSYRKIQKLKNRLTTDENDILNRYLVRIKTNVAVIENSVNSNFK